MANDFIMPPSLTQAAMDKLLSELASAYPYHRNHDMQAQAGLALAVMMGSVAAWVMFSSKNPEASLDKWLKMVNTAAIDMAMQAYPILQARTKEAGFGDQPWEPDNNNGKG